MTPGGWIIMIFSVSSTTWLFVWSFWKIFTTPGETEKVHGFEFEPEKHERDE